MQIHLTPSALAKIRHIRACQDKPRHGLRIHVAGGGICRGLEYLVALDDAPLETDLTDRVEDVDIDVSPETAEFVDGATVDYACMEEGEGFLVDPPPKEHACCCDKPS